MALPRIVIGAPSSSTGKTTVAIGLMAALSARGQAVAGFKVGPDYIDPGYHALACGRPGRNLDPFLCGPERIVPLFEHGALTPEPADVAVIEGVMGMFDGKLGPWPDGGDDPVGFGSTAHVARLLDAPVILVADTSHASRSTAAVCAGMAAFDERVRIGGVILNRVMSPRVADEVEAGCARFGLPVLGRIPTRRQVRVGSRHLGLVTADEQGARARAVVEQAGDLVGEHVDLDAVLALAGEASALPHAPWDPAAELARVGGGAVIAMAAGQAFTFRYTETAELLQAAGCTVVPFDPLLDEQLPDGTTGVYLGGGFPQIHAAALTANGPLRAQIRALVDQGMPVVAECAGLLYLCRSLDGLAMTGALDLDSAMTPRLTMGYHVATAATDSFLVPAGEQVRAHEFHRTVTGASLGGVPLAPAWHVDGRSEGVVASPAGGTASVHASYQHLHWAGCPQLAERFAAAAAGFTGRPDPATEPAIGALPGTVDLCHHGDQDLVPGTTDLAVNVHAPAPPSWLVRELTARTDGWGRYPDAEPARLAVAARHGVAPEQVLITAGGSEAFSLIAAALAPAWATVVHPQFTEPEVALRAKGHPVGRLVLRPQEGFTLDPGRVHPRSDLVVVGNPTNPTSVLHPTRTLLGLRAPGRVLVVDEAFMDCVPGEPDSLIGPAMTGLLVVRSLTKTWSIPGVRIGYVVGDPDLVARLAAHQPPWSVSAPAVDAAVATAAPEALALTRRQARATARDRDVLVCELTRIGVTTVPAPAGPFVLADLRGHDPQRLRAQLRDAGFTVRGGESFPGLGAGWLRLAVRDPDTSRAFVRALEYHLAHVDGEDHNKDQGADRTHEW
ncbi:cobyrinate a,c-diamide synthase [Propionibacterium australiense]|uniref:Hydrogenobyrinate a,c-diamide synthase n=1 Tax=Propionibacterium australiense TaxID=119981 RepID=A0A8B3FL61_9ACTN|nr:cobyrinate a,c-diamide synthase [Propionibacterium australiense]RLP08929.1 cobyrinate a,c-diamide synthase [Propionibacterium australiense]